MSNTEKNVDYGTSINQNLYISASITAKEHLIQLVTNMVMHGSLTLEEYKDLVKTAGQRVQRSAYHKICVVIALTNNEIILTKAQNYAAENVPDGVDVFVFQAGYLINYANAVINLQKFARTRTELLDLSELFIDA
jgi:hypothetical protein